MELHQLRYFLLVAKYENFSRAAEELYIAQPSVSKAISTLEAELGTNLFERNGKRVRLNEAGRTLQEKLYPVIAAIDGLKRDIQMAAGLSKSTIQLNMSAASYLLPDILIKFRQIKPLVDFRLTQSNQNAECDLCICATLPDVVLENGILVLSEEIKLAVPADSHLGSRDSVELRELKDQNFISLTKNKTQRNINNHFFELAGFSAHTEFESDNPNTLRDLVRAGLGVAMWPEVSWGLIPANKTKLLRITKPTCRRNIFVTWPKGKKLSDTSKNFLDFIKGYFLDMQHTAQIRPLD